MLTYERWSVNKNLKVPQFKEATECLKWAYNHYGDEIVYACSFGAESAVLLHLISKIKKNAHIAFIDTGLHFKETYDIIEKVREKYPDFQITFLKPNLTVEEQANEFGQNLWETNPNQCCHIRKVEPMKKMLQNYKAWISGLRRSQSETRANLEYINLDHKFKLIKICPLINWKWEEIWLYIKLYQLPYHVLHDQGYPSIGCEVCTKPVEGNCESRAGRWANHKKTECGLHLN
ncbi:phosphoadenylyl-sulfate reductase [Calidifontibacillus erzurumensis]|uniref:Adenosine 5'-phosphosulfate reductase n=1 Tax=Calidifontibacillus erzurumensis TaxID=2741433 RepID=A0A8J8GBZ4_9BACI|nr:phosphoadenylyl-sulfate reductase [Calidifontibacillus erzurumensis]NSL50882.1 phosphoadenylyl-sulfate reductase [Calidifontibacillus erzurumensis]